jgi:hypothetical protein
MATPLFSKSGVFPFLSQIIPIKHGLFPFYPQKIIPTNKIYAIMILARKNTVPYAVWQK